MFISYIKFLLFLLLFIRPPLVDRKSRKSTIGQMSASRFDGLVNVSLCLFKWQSIHTNRTDFSG